MRIGTFMCWLWGHKFTRSMITEGDMWDGILTTWKTDYCMRCGIDKL